MSIPEYLKEQCNDCGGTGVWEGTLYKRQCVTCGGDGWVWALSKEEMAERIGALEKKVARLEAPLSDMEDQSIGAVYGAKGIKAVHNFQLHRLHVSASAAEPLEGQ